MPHPPRRYRRHLRPAVDVPAMTADEAVQMIETIVGLPIPDDRKVALMRAVVAGLR